MPQGLCLRSDGARVMAQEALGLHSKIYKRTLSGCHGERFPIGPTLAQLSLCLYVSQSLSLRCLRRNRAYICLKAYASGVTAQESWRKRRSACIACARIYRGH